MTKLKILKIGKLKSKADIQKLIIKYVTEPDKFSCHLVPITQTK